MSSWGRVFGPAPYDVLGAGIARYAVLTDTSEGKAMEERATSDLVVERGSAAPPFGKGSRMRPVAIALAVLGVLAIVAVLTLVARGRAQAGTAEYAFGELAEAAREGEWETVERYVDTGAIASGYVDALFANAMSDEEPDKAAPKSRAHASSGGSSMGSSGMKDAFVQRFEEYLRTGVQQGTLEGDGGFGGLVVGSTVSSAETPGENEAVLTLSAKGDGAKGIQVTMQRTQEQWRVTAVNGLDDLLGGAE